MNLNSQVCIWKRPEENLSGSRQQGGKAAEEKGELCMGGTVSSPPPPSPALAL